MNPPITFQFFRPGYAEGINEMLAFRVDSLAHLLAGQQNVSGFGTGWEEGHTHKNLNFRGTPKIQQREKGLQRQKYKHIIHTISLYLNDIFKFCL